MHNELDEGAGTSTDEKRAVAARLMRARSKLGKRGRACLHRLFEAQAARAPSAIALRFEGRQWTYAELNARANRLARRLRAAGVGPEVPVGLYADRSCEMVVGLLAILKAGGAYVPLDPVYPEERLRFLLDDARVPVLLARTQALPALLGHDAEIVDLDDECALERDDNLPSGASPENAAYVIYTSGSTGQPKGVVVNHANVAHLLAATQGAYEFGPGDVWTLFHSFAFDFSVWEIWGALAFGGRLVVVPYWVSRSPEAFCEVLRNERVTVLNQTPSAFRQLVRAEGRIGVPGALALRLVIFGGEALEPRTLRPWIERHGDVMPRLVNMYGITETTVHVTYRPITTADLDGDLAASPIGEPIPGWKVHVLDHQLRPVPIGATGELFVGGAGLARGYLNRPELTADRFVADPFSSEPGARLYRSGDLAKRQADGSLEYIGRADQQVKIRGFRIELGEVEAALLRHPAIDEVAVVPRASGPDDVRLVAYVVARDGEVPSIVELRRWLKVRLPEYMIPSARVALEALPLTAHGKLDRDALPEPDQDADSSAALTNPPTTAVEEVIAGVWAAVLGRESVGVREDFFDLGGHSLLATQVVSRLREALGFDVPLRALFESPTVEGLAERIEWSRSSEVAHTSQPIDRAPRDGPVPTSFSQEALWFLDRLDPGRPTFNVSAAARVSGVLDIPVLVRAFAEIVRRHEALRTTFTIANGRPVQVIAPPPLPAPAGNGNSDHGAPFPARGANGVAKARHQPSAATNSGVAVFDLSRLPETDRLAEASRRAAEEGRRPFDLERGPLVRALVLKLSATEHAVVLTMHHIVTDGWSFGVAGRELAALYEAFRAGRPSPLPELPVQYADYALWQREHLQGDRIAALLAYWTKRLEGVPSLELPTDRPRPAVRTARGGLRFFRVPPALAGAVRALARSEGATPFMTLLATFQAVLHRHSGQDDFAVGTPVANRGRAEVEGLVGYFINMLALRADLSGNPSFRTLLGRVRAEALGAFEHQELPLEHLIEALHPGRDLSRTPLFQVMFVFQNNEVPDLSGAELSLAALDLPGGTGTAKFDLTLAMADDGPGMIGSLEYDADLFDESTIERLTGHFLTLLQAATSQPGLAIRELSVLSDDERSLVRDGWNRTRVDVAEAARVHRLFETQAALRPGSLALDSDGERLTYRELDRRANRLAHRLRALGVGPGVFVAVAVERSPEMAVGLLGVLKAGGAFIPLDPAYPRDRLAFMVDDSCVPVLLTQERLRGRLPAGGASVVVLDAPGALDGWPADDPRVDVARDDPAYVIYTSGSTGVPRGAIVSHGGVVNHALAAAELFDLSPEDRVLQFASLSFDIAVEELFPAWARGATVVLRGGDEILEPSRFSRWVDERRISVLDLPTAYWHAWVNDLAARGESLPAAPRLVVVGGEKAQASVLAKWHAIGGARIHWLNTYGPTETTVIATAFAPPPPPPPEGSPAGEIPIGRPIANVRTYVLDPRMELAPVGVAGELYIGGAGVGLGYLNRPDLTAERFVADPFGPEPGARLFRTGDRVRWRADGQLEFLGRCDLQLKIRGHRVEPGEVEAALLAHPALRTAAVVAGVGPDGHARLDAYIVGESGASVADDLRRWLRRSLPAYAIPSTFTALEALPMTPSGKVDRASLPPPEAGVTGSLAAHVAPRDEIESRLARLWEEVLEVHPVGISDSFFDLGGHSLLAIRLLGRIEEELGRRLALQALFLGPTIEDQAALLRTAPERTGEWSPLVAIRDRGSRPPFFCIHPAGGIVYCFGALARALGNAQPFYALQAAGLEDDRPPLTRVEDLARSYIAAIQRVQPQGPYHLGGWSLGGLVAFEMARQLAEEGHVVATLALLDTRAPAASGPLVSKELEALAREVAGLELLGPRDPAADPRDDALVLAEFAGGLAVEFGGDIPRLIAHLRGLDPDARRDYLLRFFKLDQVYFLETGPERIRRLWTVLRANLLAGAKYAPGPYAGHVLVFAAEEGVGQAQARADVTLGWRRLAEGGATAIAVPGDHAGILREPGVSVLAARLRDEIDRALDVTPPPHGANGSPELRPSPAAQPLAEGGPGPRDGIRDRAQPRPGGGDR
jgi:amino acid adenylation domain-containing protein